MSRIEPLIVRNEGKKFAVVAFYDIDGTCVDETLPERERIATIGPAKEALYRLEECGVTAGPITARSFGEAMQYRGLLATSGTTICEDGSLICLPITHGKRVGVFPNHDVMAYEGSEIVTLGSLSLDTLRSFVVAVSERAGEKAYSTVTDSPEQLAAVIGFDTVEHAKLSADRFTSAYIARPTRKVLEAVHALAPQWGIRTLGEFAVNLNDPDVDKGSALRFIADHADYLYGDVNLSGIIPIVFGNNRNDIELFEAAHELGGYGVMVAHPDPAVGYFVPEKTIPSAVIKTPGEPYGYGMKAAVPAVLQRLKKQYEVV